MLLQYKDKVTRMSCSVLVCYATLPLITSLYTLIYLIDANPLLSGGVQSFWIKISSMQCYLNSYSCNRDLTIVSDVKTNVILGVSHVQKGTMLLF